MNAWWSQPGARVALGSAVLVALIALAPVHKAAFAPRLGDARITFVRSDGIGRIATLRDVVRFATGEAANVDG